MSDSVSKKRKIWIDALRAIAIIFVVISHVVSTATSTKIIYNVFVGPVMIPLFFSISGYVFNERQGKQWEFYKHLILKIIVPSFFLSLVWLNAFLIPIKGVSQFTTAALRLISGVDYWYISACIIAEIIWFYTRKFFKKPFATCIASVLCCVAGLIMAKLDICNFAMINRAFIAQAYILIGYLFKTFEEKLCNIKWQYAACGIVSYLALAVLSMKIWPGWYIDIHINQYYNFLYSVLIIYLGCFSLFVAARKLNKAPRTLTYLGQNTLVCYMLHTKCFSVFDRLVNVLGLGNINLVLLTILKVCFSLVSCCVIAFLLNKFLPELVGRRRKNKRL